MALFHYPSSKHKRTRSPRQFVRYRTYKKYLREEFYATCVYCRTPDRLSEPNHYAVEHYRPRDRFPELETDYSNLFYACGNCNSYKGSYWPNEAQQQKMQIIPNPCDHVMHDHLRLLSGGEVEPYSLAGRWTVELLRLNESKLLEKRQFFLVNKRRAELERAQLIKNLGILESGKPDVKGQNLIDLVSDINDIKGNITEIDKILDYIGD